MSDFHPPSLISAHLTHAVSMEKIKECLVWNWTKAGIDGVFTLLQDILNGSLVVLQESMSTIG